MIRKMLASLLGLLALLVHPADSSAGELLEPQEAASFFGRTSALDAQGIRDTLADLASLPGACDQVEQPCGPGVAIKERLFGSRFVRHGVADFIVHIEHANGKWHHRSGTLMFHGKNTPYLMGVHNVYVIVLATPPELPAAAKGAKPAEHAEPPPMLVTSSIEGRDVTSALRAALKLAGIDLARAPVEDTSPGGAIHWEPLSGDAKDPGLWIGFQKIPVKQDIVGRLAIFQVKAPAKDEKAPREPVPPRTFLSAGAHFSNSYADTFGLSVALGSVFNAGSTALQTSGDNSFGAYAFAKWYWWEPRINVGPDPCLLVRPSFGLAAGTNLTHRDDINEVVIGFTAGHLWGPLGLIAGASRVPKPKPEPETGRDHVWRALVAVDFTF